MTARRSWLSIRLVIFVRCNLAKQLLESIIQTMRISRKKFVKDFAIIVHICNLSHWNHFLNLTIWSDLVSMSCKNTMNPWKKRKTFLEKSWCLLRKKSANQSGGFVEDNQLNDTSAAISEHFPNCAFLSCHTNGLGDLNVVFPLTLCTIWWLSTAI